MENTSDSFMPGPLLFCMKIERSVCYKVTDNRVKLCGYQTRQEYIIESVLYQKITAVGNPLMLVQFRKQLREIETELKRLNTLNDAGEELFTPIRTMLEILNGFAEGRNTDENKKDGQQSL